MPAASPVTLDIYVAQASTYDEDGYLGIQPDTPGQEGSAHHEAAFPLGLRARPLDPESDDAGNITHGAPCLVAWEGGQALVIPLADSRTVPGLPELAKGEAMLHGHASNFVRCHADGTITMFSTADGTPTGQKVYTRQGPAGFEHAGPWGKLTFDQNGMHVTTTSGKTSLDLGGIGGFPAPLDSFGAYASIQAAAIRLKGTMVAMGPPGTPQDAVAKSTPTLIALNALNAVLAQLLLPGAYVSPPTGGPCTPGPGLVAALTTAISTLAAAPANVPSNSTTVT